MQTDTTPDIAALADPFTVDRFAAMWDDFCDADWRLVTDPTSFLEQCEAAGLAECVPVDEEALDDVFASERGIEPGGMMWRLTPAGCARYRTSRAQLKEMEG